MGYRVINGRLYPVESLTGLNSEVKKQVNIDERNTSTSFSEILKNKINKNDSFTISNHAAARLKNISFDTEDMKRINDAINKANEKGSKSCLIVHKDVALVTSIENRTIITAVEGERAKENIFTNIDSVVLL